MPGASGERRNKREVNRKLGSSLAAKPRHGRSAGASIKGGVAAGRGADPGCGAPLAVTKAMISAGVERLGEMHGALQGEVGSAYLVEQIFEAMMLAAPRFSSHQNK